MQATAVLGLSESQLAMKWNWSLKIVKLVDCQASTPSPTPAAAKLAPTTVACFA